MCTLCDAALGAQSHEHRLFLSSLIVNTKRVLAWMWVRAQIDIGVYLTGNSCHDALHLGSSRNEFVAVRVTHLPEKVHVCPFERGEAAGIQSSLPKPVCNNHFGFQYLALKNGHCT